jgi:hypothetical protein
MITKSQLRNKVDSNKCFNFIAHVPWSETSLSRLYDIVDAQIEAGSLIDIIKARPVAFDLEKEIVTVEIVLDCSDVLEVEPEEHLGDGE